MPEKNRIFKNIKLERILDGLFNPEKSKPKFKIIKLDQHRLQIVTATISSKLLSSFLLIFLIGTLILIIRDVQSPNILSSKQFIISSVLTLFLLIIIWRKSFVEFNNLTQTVIYKRKQYKLFKALRIRYQQVDKLMIKPQKVYDEDHTEIGKACKFILYLKSGKKLTLFFAGDINDGLDLLDQIREHHVFFKKYS